MTTTMLDIFKSRLPEGLTITTANQRGGKYKLSLEYDGFEYKTDLQTTCVPKQENRYCDWVIATAMMAIALKKDDLELCIKWRDFQDGIYEPKPHGGKRTGAGRKPNALPKKNINLRVTEEEAALIKAYLAELRKTQ